MVQLEKIFNINYGNGLALNSLKKNENGINFISRTSKNNGVSSKVEKINNISPFKPGTITVSLGGSVLEAFLQPNEFYTSYHIFCLTPRLDLSENEKLFYCLCIRANKYKYNYGRQANKTLHGILVPSLDEIPTWVNKYKIPKKITKDSILTKKHFLEASDWKFFKYDEIFNIFGGYYNKKPPTNNDGSIPFIGASENNNGITSFHTKEDIIKYSKDGSVNITVSIDDKIFKGNCITVANNGNSVASAFYQENDFTCTHDVNILRLKNYELNKYLALFLCTLIKKEKYRWSYGRKWRPIRMPDSTIKLPVDKNGNPNWSFMETFIKSLPYSKNI